MFGVPGHVILLAIQRRINAHILQGEILNCLCLLQDGQQSFELVASRRELLETAMYIGARILKGLGKALTFGNRNYR